MVGALVNAVFLLALCFSITVQALKRFLNPEPIKDPRMILIVGGVGLFINIIGLVIFGHSHGGEEDTVMVTVMVSLVTRRTVRRGPPPAPVR